MEKDDSMFVPPVDESTNSELEFDSPGPTQLLIPFEQPEDLEPLRVLCIGDPHVKKNNTADAREMIEAIVNKALMLQPDLIVVMGDTLDRFEAVHIVPQTDAIHWLARLQDIAPLVVLIGNHDLENTKAYLSPYHPFAALHYWANTTVVDKVVVRVMRGHVLTFVPFVDNGRFKEALNSSLDLDYTYMDSTAIFAHQEFKGCKMGHQISSHGDEWPLEAPYVISGHIHEYQEPQANIVYIGTPIQHGFSDHDDKTISLFTFYSPNRRTHERLGLPVRLKKIVHITCYTVTTFVPDNRYCLKIVIHGLIGDLAPIMKHPTIAMWRSHGHKVTEEAEGIIPVKPYQEGTKVAKLSYHEYFQRSIMTHERSAELCAAYSEIYGRPVTANQEVELLPPPVITDWQNTTPLQAPGKAAPTTWQTTGAPAWAPTTTSTWTPAPAVTAAPAWTPAVATPWQAPIVSQPTVWQASPVSQPTVWQPTPAPTTAWQPTKWQ